jgi:flagellar biosynthesis chaperone FliJ
MQLKNEVAEVLNGFEKRMKFINIVRTITEYKYADNIRAIFGAERDKLTNIILAVMVYIKERTLSEDLDCTLADVQRFLEDISHVFSITASYDSELLAKYIIIDVLQHGGEISTFQTFNSHTMSFDMLPIRLIDEEHGKYTLTDDAFDFLFRIKDIDATLDYSVTRFKMQEYMRRDNYSEALYQSRELVSRIRNIKTGMNNFILRCRENISKVSVDEYESLVTRIRSLLEDEYKELIEIQKNAEERAAKLSDATTAGVTYEEAKKHRKALKEIIENIETTIDEQRSLINKKSNLSEQYGEILRENYRVVSFERLNFNSDIMVKIRKMNNMGDLAKYLLFPLTKPEFESQFSVENFYSAQKSFDDIEEEENLDIENTEENREKEKIEKRNERYEEICCSVFSFMKDKDTFTTGDYIDSLRVSELKDFCSEQALPYLLLSVYEIGIIDIEEWKKSENLEIQPMGEFELSWCLHQLSEELLDMKRIEIYKMDQSLTLEIKEDEFSRRIDMSMLKVEVVR